MMDGSIPMNYAHHFFLLIYLLFTLLRLLHRELLVRVPEFETLLSLNISGK